MDYESVKKQANRILRDKIAECSYIEYKKSSEQRDKILKTICAYGNNYYDNDIQYLFIGVEEENSEKDKATPILPLTGMTEGRLEKSKNELNSLRSYLYPNVSFEIISNELDSKRYLIIAVPRQTGGPFMVSEKAEKDKKIGLKAGRYIRIEAQSRIAKVDEEYDLLRKFANFHYSSLTNQEATLNDLSIDYISEYLEKTSDRKISQALDKTEVAQALKLLDRNDPSFTRVKNYVVLMFAYHPEEFIPYAYLELIVDMYGTKRKMESKRFSGPIWKQYENIVNYINDNFLNECVIREKGVAENRRVANFPFATVEELVANAIVHNNYENGKPIQIYVSGTQINIVNYNKPLPPLVLEDLNERRIFNERDTENPEIRDMFKALGIIESFGTGIGEAKQAMSDNGSPQLFYKIFSASDNVTSVVIPVNEEYYSIKNGDKPSLKTGTMRGSREYLNEISKSDYTDKVKNNLSLICECLRDSIFGNADIVHVLNCSDTTATGYLKKLYELGLINPVKGEGKGKYNFIQFE